MHIKPITYCLAAVASILGAACKHNMDHDGHKMLNITYPAAYVVNGQGNSLSVINLSENKVTGEIGLNGATYPHHVNLSPDKSRLAVAITATDLSGGHGGHGGSAAGFKFQVINSATGMIEKEIALPKMPHNAAFNPSGTELWVGQADATQSKVLVYKTADWTLQNSLDAGRDVAEITFSTDGTRAYATNTGDGTVTVFDPAAKSVLRVVQVGKDPVGAWPAANGRMYVDNELDQTVTEIDVATSAVTATIPLGFKPGYAAFHAGQEELWVSDAINGRVVVYKKQGGAWGVQNTVLTGADAHAIAFSQDGTTAYVTNQGANSVSVINASAKAKLRDIAVGLKPNGIVLKE